MLRSVDTEDEDNRSDTQSRSYWYQADLASHWRRAMRLQTKSMLGLAVDALQFTCGE